MELDIETNELRFKFSLSSKGGGITDVKLTIGADGFSALATAMANADRGTAVRELAATLASELAKQSEYDTVIVRKARQSVVEAAEHAYSEAPEGRDQAERFTRDMVRQLVNELNARDATESGESDAA